MIKVQPVYSIFQQLPRPSIQAQKTSQSKENSGGKTFQQILEEKRKQIK